MHAGNRHPSATESKDTDKREDKRMKVHSRDPGVPSKAFIGSALIRK